MPLNRIALCLLLCSCIRHRDPIPVPSSGSDPAFLGESSGIYTLQRVYVKGLDVSTNADPVTVFEISNMLYVAFSLPEAPQ